MQGGVAMALFTAAVSLAVFGSRLAPLARVGSLAIIPNSIAAASVSVMQYSLIKFLHAML